MQIIKAFSLSFKTVFLRIMLAFLGLSVAVSSHAQTYYLGVLAPQGESAAQRRWQPWLDELNQQLIEDTVVLVPLALENWQQQIEAQQFAFVIGPQVQFIKMDTTGWRWLATLQTSLIQTSDKLPQSTDTTQVANFKKADKHSATVTLADKFNTLNQRNEPSAMEQVASALWVKADSSIYHLQDLEQRKIAAVDEDAFGGYLLIAHLLQQNGMAPSHYQTQFVGYPVERVLSTLASGPVDAAIAPLCLMEEMARQGRIDKSQYRLIHPVKTSSSCQSSTKIYPNWTLAATAQAPTGLISAVNQYLFNPPAPIDRADENDVTTIRWLPPESGADAERILYEMDRHPAQKQLSTHIVDWIYAHRWWVGILAFITVISTINYGWMSWLAWRRQRQILEQNSLIRDYDYRLKHSERFAVIGEISGAISHEINQPLATIHNYAQGLLLRSQNAHLDKDEAEKALQQMINETQRASAVINNIKRWAGTSQLNEVSVDIASTYQYCILLLGKNTPDISFWYAIDYQGLQDLRLPSLLLDQLLLNAMLNSQQQGASHIMLRCQMLEDKHKSWLALHISDDAGGFDESRLKAHQLSGKVSDKIAIQTQSTKSDGLGLGLMICQRLCKSIGGTMQLRNVEVGQELNTIKMLKGSSKKRFKRNLNGEYQLIEGDTYPPLKAIIGAQVSFYLPLPTAVNDSKVKAADDK